MLSGSTQNTENYNLLYQLNNRLKVWWTPMLQYCNCIGTIYIFEQLKFLAPESPWPNNGVYLFRLLVFRLLLVSSTSVSSTPFLSTPVSSTPVSSTPVSSTHVSSTPAIVCPYLYVSHYQYFYLTRISCPKKMNWVKLKTKQSTYSTKIKLNQKTNPSTYKSKIFNFKNVKWAVPPFKVVICAWTIKQVDIPLIDWG